MELYDVIFKRRSIRRFKEESLDEETIISILEHTKKLTPLFAQIKTEFHILQDESVSGLFAIQAPQYLALYCEEKDGYNLNIGFMMQQMDLYLAAIGLGSCWLGIAKPKTRTKNGLKYQICLAFGEANQNLYRKDVSAFKREPLESISKGEDNRIEAARLAPSATNSQPWFFECKKNIIHIYRRKNKGPKALIYDRLNIIDMGIALCHMKIAGEHEGRDFLFSQTPVKEKKGYHYIGNIQ